MKTLSTVLSVAAISLLTSTAALASSGAATSKVFVSGPLILLFIGFCALVVVVQCIPAIIMFVGMIKGTVSAETGEMVEAKNN